MAERLLITEKRKLLYEEYKHEPSRGDLVIKNLYCGICSSDLKIVKSGHRALRYPVVPGHEIVGELLNMPSSFRYLKESGIREGDIVQVYPGITCGKCKYCSTGRHNLCESIKIIGFNYNGGFSSYTSFTNKIGGKVWLNKLNPDSRDIYLYTLAEPIACCINVFENIKIYKTDKVLIIGAGFMGKLLSLTASYFGLNNQYIMDFEFKGINSLPSNPTAINVKDADKELNMIKSVNPDIVVVATSNFSMVNRLPELVSPGCRICYFSGQTDNEMGMPLNANTVHYREISISGSYGNRPAQNNMAFRVIEDNKDYLKKLIKGKIYSLREYKTALRVAYSKKSDKAIFSLQG